MIDQYAAFVSKEGRTGLGNWIHRQQRKNVTPKHRAAMKTLQECRVPVQELRAEWAAQKVAQTSVRARKSLLSLILLPPSQQPCVDAPARLRRELDKVLLLQNQIDGVEKAIDDTKKTLQGSAASPHSLAVLCTLELTHERLGREVEELYASLNIQTAFPELRNLPLPFTQTQEPMPTWSYMPHGGLTEEEQAEMDADPEADAAMEEDELEESPLPLPPRGDRRALQPQGDRPRFHLPPPAAEEQLGGGYPHREATPPENPPPTRLRSTITASSRAAGNPKTAAMHTHRAQSANEPKAAPPPFNPDDKPAIWPGVKIPYIF